MLFDKKGAILITSLWIITILALLAVGIGFRVSIEARLSKYDMDRLKGTYLAKAGIFKSQELLSLDSNAYDSIRQCGFVLPPGKEPDEIFKQELGDGRFVISYNEEGLSYYGMADEERKININKAPFSVLKSLFVDEDIALSVANWRSAGNNTDDNYYKSLTPPYECKHAEFCAIEELMLVKGFTPALFAGIKDYVTVFGDGKVNINTATKRVFLAYGLNESAVQGIIDYRNGIDKNPGTKDDPAFYGLPREGDFQYLTPADIAILGNHFTTVSNYFRIEAMGMVARSRIISKVSCFIQRGDKKFLSYREY